ncbi:hypothetical protein [Nocardioides aurantiacus]|uniref:hypothetical protein n=1 Tax=Nocardioides aurantiacus TaxID=86796 RepID=UPI00403F362E
MPWSSLSSRALLVAVATLVAAGTAGCGGSGSAEESMTSLKKSRADLQSLVQDVARTLGSAGIEMEELTGAYRTCRSEPSPGLKYVAGGASAALDDGPAEPRLAKVRSALESDGWTITAGEGTVVAAERDGTTISIGQTTRGGEQVIAFDGNGECIDADSDETDALLGETETIPVR